MPETNPDAVVLKRPRFLSVFGIKETDTSEIEKEGKLNLTSKGSFSRMEIALLRNANKDQGGRMTIDSIKSDMLTVSQNIAMLSCN